MSQVSKKKPPLSNTKTSIQTFKHRFKQVSVCLSVCFHCSFVRSTCHVTGPSRSGSRVISHFKIPSAKKHAR